MSETMNAIKATDSRGIEILVGDECEAVEWKPERGANENMLHLTAKVVSLGRSRVTIEIADPRPFRSGTVLRSVGPETIEVCTYMRDGDE